MQVGGSGGSGHAASTYRGLRSRHGTSVMGEINVTPLVDVVLVLLLVFMVTAPMMNRGIDVTLPVASDAQTPPEDRIITVSMRKDGLVYLKDQPVALPLLEERVRVMIEGMPNKVAYLRADEDLRYGKVITVVDTLKKAGVEQIGFVYVLPQEKAANR
jgi:biopolymer transport protein TolR